MAGAPRILTGDQVVALAQGHGPWHREADGRIRNDKGLDPYAAVTGAWLPRREDDWTVERVIAAADFPRHKYRQQLERALGLPPQ